MKCLQCGKCCKFDWGVEADNFVPLNFVDSDGYMQKNENGSCIAYNGKTKRCKIYEKRPEACRGFKAGSLQCNRLRMNPVEADVILKKDVEEMMYKIHKFPFTKFSFDLGQSLHALARKKNLVFRLKLNSFKLEKIK